MFQYLRLTAIVAMIALLFWGAYLLAGRWDWYRGWAYLGLLIAGSSLNNLVLWIKNPELLRLRARIAKATKGWDFACLIAFGLTYLATLVTGALDGGRYQWSAMAWQWWFCGAALYGVSLTFVTWAMVANRFFEKTARIQTDRDQQVIDSGPYRYVRHPGYIGVIVGFIFAAPLMLGSWWAFVPALLSALSLIVRTALEDKMLLEELAGYDAYAKRVRYRLIPFLW